MRKYDYHWTDRKEWYQRNDQGVLEIRPDAPAEAQESDKRYLEQKKRVAEEIEKYGYLD